jgi:hypothetical protein
MAELALFCGGPAIYGGGLPKPLQPAGGGRTLLELYSRTPLFLEAEVVYLLVENTYVEAFSEVARKLSGDIRLVASENQSSTLAKLKGFCSSYQGKNERMVFSYPDIFYFDSLQLDQDTPSQSITLTSRVSSSRFPRFFVQNYVSKISSIGSPWSRSDTNRNLIFGGHLIAQPSTLIGAVEQIPGNTKDLVLEEAGFRSFVNSHEVHHIELFGDWFLADSVRDLQRIEDHLA